MATEPLVALPTDWPKMTLQQVDAALTAPGSKFEMETVDIRGVETRVWKNAPPTLAYLAQAARAFGARDFTVYRDERVSYEANYRATVALAQQMLAMGIGKGDRVALAMRNLPEWPAAFFAITAIGAIAVPLNAWWTGGELQYGIADSGARLLICDRGRHRRLNDYYAELPDLEQIWVTRWEEPLTGKFRRIEDMIGSTDRWPDLPDAPFPSVELGPDDDATIFYTSGTTGNSKGAIGTHRNIMTNILTSGYTNARSSLRRGEVPPEPEPRVSLLVIPLFHVTACSAGLMAAIATGSTVIFMHKWDPVEAMEIIEREKVSFTGGVPTIAWQLLEHPDRAKYDISSLDTISYGGAPSAPDLVRKIYEEFGALPSNGWGMTETMATVTQHGGEDYLHRPTSCGPAAPVAELKIMSADGTQEMPVGETGELWCKGPMVVKGYWNKPEATAETFVDGWVRTGDIARLDEEGFCYIVDRAKDMIIRGGENIYSSEVEDVLYAHPAVTDAALVGIPHHSLGEEPAAVVHLAPGSSASEGELRDWVAQRLAAFKVPVRILFSEDVLPRNANGKIMKRDLKDLFETA